MSKEFEITQLKKALSILLISNRFYADKENYEHCDTDAYTTTCTSVLDDCEYQDEKYLEYGGKRARKATTQTTEILGSELVEQLIKGED